MSVEHEIQLASILEVIWRRGRMMAIISLVCMVLAAAFSYTIHNRYRAEVDLVVMNSKIGERAMMFPGMTMDTYSELFLADTVLQDVIDEFRLSEEPFGLKHINALAGRVAIRSNEKSSRIQLSVELEDPEFAALVANQLANRALQLNNEIIMEEKDNSRRFIQQELTPIQEQTMRYQIDYRDLLVKNKLPLLQNELDTNNTILATLRQQHDTLVHSIRELETRQEYFEKVFSATDAPEKILQVKRSIFSNNTVLNQLEEAKPNQSIEDLTGMGYIEETINGIYYQLRSEYIKLTIDLPAMKAKFESMKKEIARLEALVIEQQEQFFRLDVEETESKRYWSQALEVVAGIEKNFDWAGTTVASERQDLKVAYYAIPDPKKVYPRRSLIVLATGMISFLLMFVYYLLKDLYGLVATERPSASV
ncbi:MAG: Wzz/FepE/Etk N-terminal domain-containing protein [Candidatus Hinthialibacter antarcticus]|nr:Wzz/FepE/Etk N-terminal domain-containing protein [Candidatus Hinthialibacter antarcticus]